MTPLRARAGRCPLAAPPHPLGEIFFWEGRPQVGSLSYRLRAAKFLPGRAVRFDEISSQTKRVRSELTDTTTTAIKMNTLYSNGIDCGGAQCSRMHANPGRHHKVMTLTQHPYLAPVPTRHLGVTQHSRNTPYSQRREPYSRRFRAAEYGRANLAAPPHTPPERPGPPPSSW